MAQAQTTTPQIQQIAEINATRIEALLPRTLQQQMGKFWESFKYELGHVLQEYRTTPEMVRDYLLANATQINRAIDIVNNRIAGLNQEQLGYIVTSLFVSAYLHGLPPAILLAVCEQESGFGFVSGTGGVGILQLTSSSALVELQHPNQEYRKRRREQVGDQAKRFGGQEFYDVVRGPRVQTTSDNRLVIGRRDMVDLLESHALYSAVWGARTILLKASMRECAEITALKNQDWLRRLFENYNGGASKEAYGRQVLGRYRIYSEQLSRPTTEYAMLVPKREKEGENF